jgi:hypothetical protein
VASPTRLAEAPGRLVTAAGVAAGSQLATTPHGMDLVEGNSHTLAMA